MVTYIHRTRFMAKILFISGIEIFPPLSGGQLRSSNLTNELSKNHEVEIYSFTGRKQDYLNFKKSSTSVINQNLKEYTNRHPFWGVIQFIFYQIKLPPIWLTFILSFYLPKDLKNKLKNADTIILDFPFLYPIFKYRTKARKIINTHNAEYQLYQNNILVKLVKNIEEKSFRIADKVIFCSENDMQKFNIESLQHKSLIIPNGIDLIKYQAKDESKNNQLKKELAIDNQHTIFIFTGSKYYPNQIAVEKLKEFAKENENYLLKNNIIILIVGSVGDEFKNEKTIKITGKVDSIIPYLQISHFALNNIEIGSGTNVKMFEYIATELVILSTEFGTRGFQLVSDTDYIKFDQNYLTTFQQAISLNSDEKKAITKSAFNKNEHLLSMTKYLKDIT